MKYKELVEEFFDSFKYTGFEKPVYVEIFKNPTQKEMTDLMKKWEDEHNSSPIGWEKSKGAIRATVDINKKTLYVSKQSVGHEAIIGHLKEILGYTHFENTLRLVLVYKKTKERNMKWFISPEDYATVESKIKKLGLSKFSWLEKYNIVLPNEDKYFYDT